MRRGWFRSVLRHWRWINGDKKTAFTPGHEALWPTPGSNQWPSACEMEVIAGHARSCWSERTRWTSKPPFSRWSRDWRRITGGWVRRQRRGWTRCTIPTADDPMRRCTGGYPTSERPRQGSAEQQVASGTAQLERVCELVSPTWSVQARTRASPCPRWVPAGSRLHDIWLFRTHDTISNPVVDGCHSLGAVRCGASRIPTATCPRRRDAMRELGCRSRRACSPTSQNSPGGGSCTDGRNNRGADLRSRCLGAWWALVVAAGWGPTAETNRHPEPSAGPAILRRDGSRRYSCAGPDRRRPPTPSHRRRHWQPTARAPTTNRT